MTAENFCYWLQGFFELNEVEGFNEFGISLEQVQMIKDHLDLVFTKVTDSGYQLIDTNFKGVQAAPLCGLKWETDYYQENQPTTICETKEKIISPGVSIMERDIDVYQPKRIRLSDLTRNVNNETKYC